MVATPVAVVSPAPAWVLLRFTVPYDTTGTGDPGRVSTATATCATADSAERPLALYADSTGHSFQLGPSGSVQRAWARFPADGRARLVWVRAYDYHLVGTGPPIATGGTPNWAEAGANAGPRSNAVSVLARTSAYLPADTLVTSTRGGVRQPSQGPLQARTVAYTTPAATDPTLHVATFSYLDSIPDQIPPFTGPGVPAIVTYEQAMGYQRAIICAIPMFTHWALRGAWQPCP